MVTPVAVRYAAPGVPATSTPVLPRGRVRPPRPGRPATPRARSPVRRRRGHTVRMTVAMIGRWVGAIAGGLLVLTAWASLVVTLIVARPVGNWLTRWVDRLVNGAFRLATSRMADYRRRDRILAAQAAAI